MTDQIRALIEAMADYCEAPDPRRAGADLWDRIDAALGPPDTRQASTATALRALLPTRDPRVDPRPGDVLRWPGGSGPIVSVVRDVGDDVSHTLTGHATTRDASCPREDWPIWDDVGGIDAVQVLYVAPGVDLA